MPRGCEIRRLVSTIVLSAFALLSTCSLVEKPPRFEGDTGGDDDTDSSPDVDTDTDTDTDGDSETDTGTGFEIDEYVVSSIAASGHSCAITDENGLMCWGYNSEGELGDGTTDMSFQPVAVEGLGSEVYAVAAGAEYTCALTSVEGVECWGNNDYGQLGDGTTAESHYPVDVVGLGGPVVSVSAKVAYSCALTAGGDVWCWGGVLRYGDVFYESATPELIIGDEHDIVRVDAGGDHACAVDVDGSVYCWGDNHYGQLGTGDNDSGMVPREVVGLAGAAVDVSAGVDHTCAVLEDGGLMCWGSTNYGVIGNGTDTGDDDELLPVLVIGPENGVVGVTAGWKHTCALLEGGAASCWGRNSYGQLGDGSKTDRSTPVEVAGLDSTLVEIRAGCEYTCGRNAEGGVRCWGQRYMGALGDGELHYSTVPIQVDGCGSDVETVVAGSGRTCALTESDEVYCWGSIEPYTAVGNPFPVMVGGIDIEVDQLESGMAHVCVVSSSGGVKCWGGNSSGELGDGTTTDSNDAVETTVLGAAVVGVANGGSFTCALDFVGGVVCWGNNMLGQLGDGTFANSLDPVQVVGLSSGIEQIAAGYNHCCALTNAGEVKCWGNNYSGQLGDGTTVISPAPVDVVGLDEEVQSITAGNGVTCALTVSGAVKCWGFNKYGQLGNGGTVDSSVPVDVTGMGSGIEAVAAIRWHTCALRINGSVACWGYNRGGQLGDGTMEDSLVPVEVAGLSTGVSVVAAGGNHTCVVTDDGDVFCWGSSESGELGNGVMIYAPWPVVVVGFEE